jgi:hypothetical protein
LPTFLFCGDCPSFITFLDLPMMPPFNFLAGDFLKLSSSSYSSLISSSCSIPRLLELSSTNSSSFFSLSTFGSESFSFS